MSNIININSKQKDLTNEDIFNLFLIVKSKEQILINFDLKTLMYSFPRWKNLQRFKRFYENTDIKKDRNNKEYINLVEQSQKNIKEGILFPYEKEVFYILADENYFNELQNKYTINDIENFNSLMFYINNDLKYGIDNWDILFEDEIVEVPGYLPFISDEFIDENKKDPNVKKKMKVRAKENLKNLGF